MNHELRGRWALVTGASSGLGADFARQLAGRGANLILVARRADRLEALAEELLASATEAGESVGATAQQRATIEVDVRPMDLTLQGAPEELVTNLAALGRMPDILINNAGFGLYGEILSIPWADQHRMLELNIIVVAQLSRLCAPEMVRRGWGRMMQVSSVVAFQATPTYGAYAASKSFVLNFSEALHNELQGTGVTSTALCPGATATEFLEVSGQTANASQRLMMMSSADVAAIGLRAMIAGRSLVVAGWVNRLLAWSVRWVPRRLATALAGRILRGR